MRSLRFLQQHTTPFITVALNICFPPRCSACGRLSEAAHGFCRDCFARIAFIDTPYCACCGFPFSVSLDDGLCGQCLQERPPYEKARAAFHYDDTTRALITRFKYQDRTDRAPFYGRLLHRAAYDLLPGCDHIVPVPLHTRRLLQRRFNQSALLSFALARRCHIPVLPDALLRVRHTTPQAGLPRTQRLENVKGAFRVNHRHADALRNQTILLIDDVMTTGATILACTRALLGAGAKNVRVLTLARTVRE